MTLLQTFENQSNSSGHLVEFRRYRLHPGRRETMIELFDREFVESQEALGMRVIGQFRDLDDPDSFVWLRGFSDMDAREKALTGFYTGPVWMAHRDAANGTMINSDNVLLLSASVPGRGFAATAEARPCANEAKAGPGLVTATIAYLAPGTDRDFAAFFEERVRPALTDAGAEFRASFIAERSANTFPRLPVREGETVFVWFTSFADMRAYDSHLHALSQSRQWQQEIFPEIDRRMWRKAEVAQLAPTHRSLLHG
jgi:hypothetical protein